MTRRKKISVCSGAYNEGENIQLFYDRVLAQLKKFPEYDYEFIIADNKSTDNTREVMRRIATADKNFKCIFNANNFGAPRSGYNTYLQCTGDAMIGLCTDLQDPPEMIEQFILKWQEGYDVVCAIKKEYGGTSVMTLIRKFYYRLLDSMSEVPLIQNFHGFGLYDRKVLDAMKQFHEVIPYPRGLISEIGFKRCEIPYVQAPRQHGRSSYNFFSYYDYAITGLVNYSKVPLRLAVFSGIFIGFISFLIAMVYLLLKLIYWDTFSFGLAPLIIGMFFLGSIQLIFIGIVGEYIGAIWTQVKNKPLVVEEERINFDP
ncbi:MAG: hypothetical protein BWX73_03407 [Lentisphaerae bacterium ADurb.Bin082]|mgnify:CR=1 FL=1|nr:MAG: hypothetical protein BWX73_03407 [Lentisphaerae bacterium ADurb.Bin082]